MTNWPKNFPNEPLLNVISLTGVVRDIRTKWPHSFVELFLLNAVQLFTSRGCGWVIHKETKRYLEIKPLGLN